jgi:N-acetylneuraminic acid mutarotase
MAFAQEIQWIRRFRAEYRDSAYGVSVDMVGNVYVVGWTNGTLPGQRGKGSFDAFLCKYDSNGKEIWTRRFGMKRDDFAYGVSVDMAGNVYVVGSTSGALPGQEKAWTRQFGTRYPDYVCGVSVDKVGNVYVVGGTFETLPGQEGKGGADAFIVKFGPGPRCGLP